MQFDTEPKWELTVQTGVVQPVLGRNADAGVSTRW